MWVVSSISQIYLKIFEGCLLQFLENRHPWVYFSFKRCYFNWTFRCHMSSTSTSRWTPQTTFTELVELAGLEVARYWCLIFLFLIFCCYILLKVIFPLQGGRVTSFVDNQGGVKVVQNLETAVRKNIEIQQVIIWIIFQGQQFWIWTNFSGEQQYHQDNQIQKREVGEDTGVAIKVSTFSNQEKVHFFLLPKIGALVVKTALANLKASSAMVNFIQVYLVYLMTKCQMYSSVASRGQRIWGGGWWQQ